MGLSLDTGDSRGRPQPTVNVTPLVDVTLVVLIIFMVVTPLITKTFWLNIPVDSDEEPVADAKPDVVFLSVDEHGALFINKKPKTEAEIRAELPRMLAGKSSKVLHFNADDRAPYEAAVAAMDLARSAGANSIAIEVNKLTP